MTQSPDYVLLARSLPHHCLGGMEIVAWDLARALAKSGAAVEIITTDLPGSPGIFTEDGVRVTPLEKTPSGIYSSAWWRLSKKAVAAGAWPNARGFISVSAAGFSALHSQPKGIPFLMQAHGTSWGGIQSKLRTRKLLPVLGTVRNWVWLARDLAAYREFDAVVAVGDRVALDLKRYPAALTLSSNKIHQIDNGVDTGVFGKDEEDREARRAELGIPSEKFVIFTAARLHMQKGLRRCLRAVQTAVTGDPDIVYLIAGEGPERRALEREAQELGISNHVRFLGRVDRATVARTCRASDLFLFLTECVEVGLPMNVLEAWASGLPTLLSHELEVDGSPSMRSVNGDDHAGVARCILEMRRALKVDARVSQLPTRFTLQHSAANYQSLIEQLVQARLPHAVV